jgi:hypothetical protein
MIFPGKVMSIECPFSVSFSLYGGVIILQEKDLKMPFLTQWPSYDDTTLSRNLDRACVNEVVFMDSINKNNVEHEHAHEIPPEGAIPQGVAPQGGDFTPLLVIFITVILFTLVRQVYHGPNFADAMYDFMGSFFFILGSFKVLKWDAFAEAYSTYDLIAQRSKLYAYLYPLIEIGLGIMYLVQFLPLLANILTLVLMSVSSVGVALELRKKEPIQCACLGTVFDVPMTKVTLFEDVLMVLMALCMLVF